MVPRWWLQLLCLAGGILEALAQTDSIGFISIDCGLPGEGGYIDDTMKLAYIPDTGFIDSGTNHNISAEYLRPIQSRRSLFTEIKKGDANICPWPTHTHHHSRFYTVIGCNT
jgi:hypothetical protein